MRAWLNGTLLADPHAPALRVDDHGITVGDGLYETMRVVDDEPFALTRHLVRLAAGAARMGLELPEEAVLRRAVAEVLDGAGLAHGRLRITCTGGPGPAGSARGDGPVTLLVTAEAVTPRSGGAVVVRVPWVRNDRGAVAGVKTISFAENVVALAYARERGADEALLANTRGHVCEGTGSNVGYVIDGRARTPSLASGCLPGVTRGLALEWCDLVEVDEPAEILDLAEEVFLMSTTREIQPVQVLDGRRLDAPGPVTAALMRSWADATASAGMDP